MPKRGDIHSILIIGAGPIIIGQACEFDYSGTQAVRALKEEGYRVILINSNPATIMTDPNLADATYIEPLTVSYIEEIIKREKPDAILPTVGGQTGLNLAMSLHKSGVLDAHSVELIGAQVSAIEKAEDREEFKKAMDKVGINTAKGGFVHSWEEADNLIKEIKFPAIIRPSFTLGGTGGSVAYNGEEFQDLVERGLKASPTTEVLIEESLLGWKEFELEVIRDKADNAIIVCSIENIDPMGVHTGDSVTVAPAMTLSDKEMQLMRNWSLLCLRTIGVETGGSNVQFAVNPENGRCIIIEMNPRVSRSSALASKATGFPIAKVAAKLAVGYTLDELPNDITGKTVAAFEPTIDYVVTKVPRFDFEKFPSATGHLGVQMQSVGEVMSIGRTFKESLQKAYRSLEVGLDGLEPKSFSKNDPDLTRSRFLDMSTLRYATSFRLLKIRQALVDGMTIENIYQQTKIDPWFLNQIKDLVGMGLGTPIRTLKQNGFSDKQISRLMKKTENEIRSIRKVQSVVPSFKIVDTCAAEFEAQTPYCYSSYEYENEIEPLIGKKGELMKLICPDCGKVIDAEDISMKEDLALCKECNEAYPIGLCRPDKNDFDQNILLDPPSGCSVENGYDGAIIHISQRSLAALLFLIPFTCIWGGGSLGGIYGSQIKKGTFEWGISLFGLPFLIGTIVLVSVCVFLVFFLFFCFVVSCWFEWLFACLFVCLALLSK